MAEALTVAITAQPGDVVTVAGTGFANSTAYTAQLKTGTTGGTDVGAGVSVTSSGTGTLSVVVPIPLGTAAGTYHVAVDTANVTVTVTTGPVRQAYYLDWSDGYQQGPYGSQAAAADVRDAVLGYPFVKLGKGQAGPQILRADYTVVVGTETNVVLPGEN